MIHNLKSALAMLLGLFAVAAQADEAEIRKSLQTRFRDSTVETIAKTPLPGIYEVVVGGRILYTDEKGGFVLIGNLIDIRSSAERDLTSERTAQLAADTLKHSLDLAFKRVRGNGKRVVYTFEDPNCGWCKKLHGELTKVNDVTIYTFLWPILTPESVDKSKAIWCSKDRVKSWDEAMTKGSVTATAKGCDNPVEKNLALAKRFGLRGTPAMLLPDGRQIGGFLTAAQLEQELNAASSK